MLLDDIITCFSVIPLLVRVSVKTDGGLQQQTVARTVWLSSGTHLQRKSVIRISYMYMYIEH